MKKHLFVLFFIAKCSLFIANCYAQQPTQEWVARYVRNPGQVMGPYYALDKFGNSYVAGDNVINDSVNILCVKYNTSGVQLWATLYKSPGDGFFYPQAMAIDSFGNAYVTSTFGQTALSAQNILIIKFDGVSGAVVWARKYIGQYGTSNPEDLKVDFQNNIYVVGQADSSLLCIKYNSNGDSLWVRNYHVPDYTDGHACTIDDSLNIIITGERDHCVSFPPPGGCFDTLITLKYSSNGDLRWVKTYFYPLNPSISIGMKVVANQAGDIFVIGKTRRQSSGVFIFVTIKYDRNGIQQWSSIYDDGQGDNRVSGLALDRINSALFVVGGSYFNGSTQYCITIRYNINTGDTNWVRKYGPIDYICSGAEIIPDISGNSYVTGIAGPFNSNFDVLTIRYSTLGAQNWLMSYNGPSNSLDAGSHIQLDTSNNVYVCGVSQNDYIVLKYSQTTSIHNVSSTTPKKFKLLQNYPNPFNPSTKIRFQIPKQADVKLKVFDMLGREVNTVIDKQMRPGIYEIDWNAGNYSSGVYFYKLITDEFTETKKMVIVK